MNMFRRDTVGAPGPPQHPVLGHMLDIRREGLGFFMKLPAYGDVVRYQLVEPTYFVHKPEHIKQVLQSSSPSYGRGKMHDLLRLFLGDGLVTTDGEHWLGQRRLMQPAFA